MIDNDERLSEMIDNHKIISFDIFDTLLIRPFCKPTDLFHYLEDIFNHPGYAKRRILTESKLRKRNKDRE